MLGSKQTRIHDPKLATTIKWLNTRNYQNYPPKITEIGHNFKSEPKLIENEKPSSTPAEYKKVVLPRTVDESVYHFKQKTTANQKNFIKSRITHIGYLIMLFIRLFGEICFIYLENQLGKHQSQNTEFWNAFNLKENWICSSNNKDTAAVESLEQLIPIGNRSEAFWTDDLNVACLQHRVTVTVRSRIYFRRIKYHSEIEIFKFSDKTRQM